MMRFQQRAETRARTGFTIDFTFYKVLIIMLMSLMFMTDLCYIFIYIPEITCVFSKPYEVATKTILIEVCLLLNKYDEKNNNCCIIIGSVFLKKKHLKAI